MIPFEGSYLSYFVIKNQEYVTLVTHLKVEVFDHNNPCIVVCNIGEDTIFIWNLKIPRNFNSKISKICGRGGSYSLYLGYFEMFCNILDISGNFWKIVFCRPVYF